MEERSLADQKRILMDTSALQIAKVPEERRKDLFPYSELRDSQSELVQDVISALWDKKHIVAHAPTGLGKTIASLGPALAYCMQHKKTLFFVTSRQTQHIMAIKTLLDIQKEHGIKIQVLDLIGKKSMCLQPGIQMLSSADFSEFCKHARENRTCEFYNTTRNKDNSLKLGAEVFTEELDGKILHVEELMRRCENEKLCPYEIALARGEKVQVVISDYYYIFHEDVRTKLFAKTDMSLENCVVIIDEAHNLPERIKDLATSRLTSSMLDRALKEAVKFEQDLTASIIRKIADGITVMSRTMSHRIGSEAAKLVKKEEFNVFIEQMPFEEICGVLSETMELVREEQKKSSIAGILEFIIAWQGQEKGFSRILSIDNGKITLSYKCLDPSVVSSSVFKTIISSISISATLETKMYADLLDIPHAVLKSYDNPFPEKNALNLIIPTVTTKFSERDAKAYQKIAIICADILKMIPGNAALFFPSYDLRDKIYNFLIDLVDREYILEQPQMQKEEKSLILKEFLRPTLKDKVLLATSAGSFGEGIDLPGGLLKCVIVIGLPFKKPTLEVAELIKYYDEKFGRGWDYGYIIPSFSKTFQNVGRCIRSEHDRGILIYLDERFAESRYLRFFEGRNPIITKSYDEPIKKFIAQARW